MRKAIISILSLAIIIGVAFFFFKAFNKNWASVHSYEFEFNYMFLFLSFAAITVNYLLSTSGWHIALNELSGRARFTFPQSVATVNASRLVKYIPGKVWSYALQMYWLVNAGFSKALVLYVNIINLLISIITTLTVGLAYLFLSSS